MLDLIWRSLIKMSNLDPVRVVSIEHADKKPKEITKWINSINDLHRTKPPPQVQYTKSMPDIEMLMQEWPPEFEQRLKQVPQMRLCGNLCRLFTHPRYRSSCHPRTST